ncbi:MAG TPA: hypothetical protein VH143_34675 [Kofleriaceae bacterium]|jgi:hypothetical protein|nr:hypothetical protein [Kofleriaceae bacterium]
MRVGAILLATCVAIAAVRAPHLRRAQPTATLSAPTAHHHHARSHRSPATVAAPLPLPAPELALVDLAISVPDGTLDREPLTLVARGPPGA